MLWTSLQALRERRPIFSTVIGGDIHMTGSGQKTTTHSEKGQERTCLDPIEIIWCKKDAPALKSNEAGQLDSD